MVNGPTTRLLLDARKSDSDSSRFRKPKLYGTKLPLVVQVTRDHQPMYSGSFSCPTPSAETGLADNDARAVGDKIELTVTIIAREHYHHGRKRY